MTVLQESPGSLLHPLARALALCISAVLLRDALLYIRCLQSSIHSTSSCQYLCEKHSKTLSVSEVCYICTGYSVLNLQGCNWG